MKAIAEIQILPVGSNNAWASAEVERAHDILAASGLRTDVHALGTDIEGELEDVFDALKQLHEQLHRRGVLRLSTVIKLGTERARGAERTEETSAELPSAGRSGSDSFVTVWQIASPVR